MNLDPKDVLAEFGIDVKGPDPDGQYQWKMLSLKAGSPERQRLEKAWSAYVLDRKEVDLAAPLPTATPAPHSHPASASAIRGKNAPAQPKPVVAKAGPGAMDWIRKRWVVVVLAVVGIAVLWLFMHDRGDHRSIVDPATAVEWRSKYEAIKTMLDESGHDNEHHEEFILLAEAAKVAIKAGQGAKMLEQLNADLAAERGTEGPKPITSMSSHTAQWKVIVQALVMNKAELLDHEKFKGHHEGEL